MKSAGNIVSVTSGFSAASHFREAVKRCGSTKNMFSSLLSKLVKANSEGVNELDSDHSAAQAGPKRRPPCFIPNKSSELSSFRPDDA